MENKVTFFNLEKKGYFYNYIFNYNNYTNDVSILDYSWLKGNVGLFACGNKKFPEHYLTGILYFDSFDIIDLINMLNLKLDNFIASRSFSVRDLKYLNIIVKVWMHTTIFDLRLKADAQLKFNKLLLKFQNTINKLVAYKLNCSGGLQEYSRYWTEQILLKELKPVLHIKVALEKQEECLKHLLNLMSKQYASVTFYSFRNSFCFVIKKYQTNYEHLDIWF